MNETSKTTLLKIIESVQSWHMVHAELCNQSNSGDIFELFCKYYYLTEPSVCLAYKNVWLFKDTPQQVKIKLNLGERDYGVDLVLEDKEGHYSLVQCKFRSDQSIKLSWTKDSLANLFAEGIGGAAKHFIIFTNASEVDDHSLGKSTNFTLVSFRDLLEIEADTFQKITKNLLGQSITHIPKIPRPYQEIAIQNVLNGFKNYSCGQLILPCGAGKTLTALWIKERLESKKTLVIVPSLALLRQIKKEWSSNINRYLPYMCVCSEKDIDSGGDSSIERVHLQGEVTTQPAEIKEFLQKHPEVIIYSTYQSLVQVSLAANSLGYEFDLAICDEAHKTAGSKRSIFALVHDKNQLKIDHRLYMTATPRITGEALKQSLDSETLKLICDMSNPEDYGPEFHRMTFKEAIDQNILCDYKIAAIGISDTELKTAIDERAYVDSGVTLNEIANNIALAKFMDEQQVNHAITFHSSIKQAKAFADRHTERYQESVDSYHVNGQLTTIKRVRLMDEFKASPKAIMTNARCLTEGVDVPAIDVVYFCDPKNSKIDIVQAAGRALRCSENKKFGYIVVPIYHNSKDDLDKTIENGPFKNLVKVIMALLDQDERLVDEIQRIKLSKGLRKNGVLSFDGMPLELITMQGFEKELKSSLFYQLIDKVRVPWRSFLEARVFVHLLKLNNNEEWRLYCKSGEKPVDIPSNPDRTYENQGWKSTGDWLGTNVVASFEKKFRLFESARLFVHKLKLKNEREWRLYCKQGNKPDDIPSNPNKAYRDKGWKDMGDWLGTDTIGPRKKEYRSFEAARLFIHTLKLQTRPEWRMYCKKGNKPDDIPSNPNKVYKNKGYDGMEDWLGKEIREN